MVVDIRGGWFVDMGAGGVRDMVLGPVEHVVSYSVGGWGAPFTVGDVWGVTLVVPTVVSYFLFFLVISGGSNDPGRYLSLTMFLTAFIVPAFTGPFMGANGRVGRWAGLVKVGFRGFLGEISGGAVGPYFLKTFLTVPKPSLSWLGGPGGPTVVVWFSFCFNLCGWIFLR